MLVSKMAPKIINSARDPRVAHVEGACHDDGNSVRMSSGFVTSDICAVTEWAVGTPGEVAVEAFVVGCIDMFVESWAGFGGMRTAFEGAVELRVCGC